MFFLTACKLICTHRQPNPRKCIHQPHISICRIMLKHTYTKNITQMIIKHLLCILQNLKILHTWFIFKVSFYSGFVRNSPGSFVPMWPTLEGAGCLLSQSKMLLCQMVHWLVLVDLYTGADVTIAVQEEGEGAGKMLTVKKKKKGVTYLSGIKKNLIKAQYG